MAAIKRFFQKRKMDIKFKTAGGGHRLTEDTKSGLDPRAQRPVPQHRAGPTHESRAAADAALNRMEQPRAGISYGSGVKGQVRREMAAEAKAAENDRKLANTYSAPTEVELEKSSHIAGIYFKCPMIGPAVLPKSEMEEYIHTFLLSQLAEEPQMTSAMMIQTLNKDAAKVKVCVETLCKYLDNVIANPDQEKYRKLRINNKAFKERIEPLEGSEEFIQSVGFERKMIIGPDGVTEEEFYVLGEEYAADTARSTSLKEILLEAEPIKPELDHNVKVFYPSRNASRVELPSEFYNVSPEDIQKEQQIRQEAVEKMGMLRTKEMRERERQKELRRYRYCLLRIKLPDGLILQGTFKALSKLTIVLDFIREHLEMDWIPFTLSTGAGQKLTEDTCSLAEYDLAPAAVVNFEYEATILRETMAQKGISKINSYLKQDVMALIQQL